MNNFIYKLENVLRALTLFFFAVLTDFLLACYDSCKKRNGFESEFASAFSIARIYNKGLVITRNGKLTRKKSFEGILLCAQTGSGKTTRYLIKMVLDLENAVIICNDPSFEIAPLTAGAKHQQGLEILYNNFSDSSKSWSYNFLSQIHGPNDLNNINKIGHMLAYSSDKGGKGDPFWTTQNKVVICLMIQLVMYQAEEVRNMVNVLQLLKLLGASPVTVDKMILQTHDKQLCLNYKSFISTPSKTLHSIISGAKAALEMFENPEIARVTSFSTSINLDTFRKEPKILYLNSSVGDSKMNNVLNGLMLEQIYSHFLRKLPEKSDLDVFFIFEELASTFVNILPLALSQSRKYRISNTCVIQDPQQLKTLYGEEASTITDNLRTHIYMPGLSNISVLKNLEALSGTVIHKDKDGKERTRPLITAPEIRTLGENKSVVMTSNSPIILARSSPYYKSWRYKAMTKIPQPPIKSDIPDCPVPLIGINPPKSTPSDENTK